MEKPSGATDHICVPEISNFGWVGSYRTNIWLGHRIAKQGVPQFIRRNMTKAIFTRILPRIPHDGKWCSGTRAAPECLCSVSEQSTGSCHFPMAHEALFSPLGKKKKKMTHPHSKSIPHLHSKLHA